MVGRCAVPMPLARLRVHGVTWTKFDDVATSTLRQVAPEVILAVDLYGTALVLEDSGNVIARGGSVVVISSQSVIAWER